MNIITKLKFLKLKKGKPLKKYEIIFKFSKDKIGIVNIYSVDHKAAEQMFYKLCKIKYPNDSKIINLTFIS